MHELLVQHKVFELVNGFEWYFDGHIPKDVAHNKVVDFLNSINDKRGKDDIAGAEHIWVKLVPSTDMPECVSLVESYDAQEGMFPVTRVEDMRWVEHRESVLQEARMNGYQVA